MALYPAFCNLVQCVCGISHTCPCCSVRAADLEGSCLAGQRRLVPQHKIICTRRLQRCKVSWICTDMLCMEISRSFFNCSPEETMADTQSDRQTDRATDRRREIGRYNISLHRGYCGVVLLQLHCLIIVLVNYCIGKLLYWLIIVLVNYCIGKLLYW